MFTRVYNERPNGRDYICNPTTERGLKSIHKVKTPKYTPLFIYSCIYIEQPQATRQGL